ncbi:hypothetical protein AMJ80_01480 [bacterium SM23_31]|nr:MAG: hypothetical protein AMJ80_01480 [bacterium SM23_31]
MRNTLFTGLFILLLFFNCSDDDVQTTEMEPLTDVLTLELSFGADDEKLKSEFLLVAPEDIDVDNEDNIYVLDEDKIKVFDKNGVEKTIFGGHGQGPGEFTYPKKLSINSEGLLTVLDQDKINIFSADNKFIKRNRPRFEQLYINYIKEKALLNFKIQSVYSLNETERILSLTPAKELKGTLDLVTAYSLVYEKSDTLIELVQYAPDNIKGISDKMVIGVEPNKRMFYTPDPWYHLIVTMLSNKHVAYSHSVYDIINDGKEFRYIIHVVNLENLQKSQISHAFKPVDVQKEIDSGKYTTETGEFLLKARLENANYLPPLDFLHCDKNLLFAVHSTGYVRNLNILKKGEKIESLTDIFDIETGKYLRSAYFPFIPDVIKNGYAYRTHRNPEGFSIIEKYKIDPAVYVK